MKSGGLIHVFDFDAAEIKTVFALAAKIKRNPSAYRNFLSGKVLGLIFEKPSMRTRVAFEVGVTTLGGHVIYLGPDDIQLGVREEVRDIARVLKRYLDGVVLRTYSHKTILDFARHFEKPVINGLSDLGHPCQAMTDFFTLREIFGSLEGRKMSYVGDGNNVCNSLLLMAARLGTHLAIATPKSCGLSADILTLANREAKKTKARLEILTDPKAAVRSADVVYTDVWVSMGQEENAAEKRKHFKGFQVNEALLKHAKKGAVVMHCLPAHRGEEIDGTVLEGKRAVVFDQAENRLHVQRAILIYLFGRNQHRIPAVQMERDDE